MDDQILKDIEECLNIKFYDWQRKYLNNNEDPEVPSDRKCGKTFVYMIWLMFNYIDKPPLDLYKRSQMIRISDYPNSNYYRWFIREFERLYLELLRYKTLYKHMRIVNFHKPKEREQNEKEV